MLRISRENPSYVLGKEVPVAHRAVSGDTVQFETYDCFEDQIQTSDYPFESLDWERINPVSGPLYVEGAEVGDTLAVEILSIEIGDQIAMITGPDMGVMGDELTENAVRICPVKDDKVIFDKFEVPLRKMVGVIGTAPSGEAVASGVPDAHGGNMDCTSITEGATLYLPVAVPGALLFMGDLHATMGDGEIAVCGGEVAGAVTVRVRVVKNLNLPLPAVVNEDNVIALASKVSLDDAAVLATKNMCDIVEKSLGLSKADATFLLTLAADLKVCQIVDPLKTMRMELSRAYFDGKNPFEL